MSIAVKKKRKMGINDLDGKPPQKGINYVPRNKNRPYHARCTYNKKQVEAGYHSTHELAAEALLEKRANYEANPELTNIPKPPRTYPERVSLNKNNKTNPYRTGFTFDGKRYFAGNHPTPELASEAEQKKRTDFINNPELANQPKPPRNLPKGIYLVDNHYRAKFHFNGKPKNVGTYSTLEEALTDLNKIRVEYGLQPTPPCPPNSSDETFDSDENEHYEGKSDSVEFSVESGNSDNDGYSSEKAGDSESIYNDCTFDDDDSPTDKAEINNGNKIDSFNGGDNDCELEATKDAQREREKTPDLKVKKLTTHTIALAATESSHPISFPSKQQAPNKAEKADAREQEIRRALSIEIQTAEKNFREKEDECTAKSLKIASMPEGEDSSSLQRQLRILQTERRAMNEVILKLRGNIRVYVRIRPGEGDTANAKPAVIPNTESSVKVGTDNKPDQTFDFDKVFPSNTSQETVFANVRELVQSAADGYSVCLFSYGQTGSGKTHTMQGSGIDQMRGIIPRAIEQIGVYKKQLESGGWKYEMKVSFVEIYNDTVRDLLRESTKEKTHTIFKGGRVSNLNVITLEPTNATQVKKVLLRAANNRTVDTTDKNHNSSRSHAVFTLNLVATHEESEQCLRGTLNLVDLAGSEGINRIGATRKRGNETKAINKSLSSLIDVITAIGNKQEHIPFRNSKLTHLLKTSLSANGKTLMIVNLSPTEENKKESMSSLRFASQVNKCELGKAKKNAISEVSGGGRKRKWEGEQATDACSWQ